MMLMAVAVAAVCARALCRNNDPNGVTYDEASGLYHRFYQYDKTYSDSCMHGKTYK